MEFSDDYHRFNDVIHHVWYVSIIKELKKIVFLFASFFWSDVFCFWTLQLLVFWDLWLCFYHVIRWHTHSLCIKTDKEDWECIFFFRLMLQTVFPRISVIFFSVGNCHGFSNVWGYHCFSDVKHHIYSYHCHISIAPQAAYIT
mgnify:CR=1 FL=1